MNVSNFPPMRITLLAAAVLALAACGGKQDADAAGDATASPAAASEAATETAEAAPAFATPTLADGPDVCFRAIAEHLGADAKVSEITSRFDTDGTLEICTVDYQNPDDARKLVGVRMDTEDGTFSQPHDIELTVTGNAAEFRLEDYLIELSKVDAAGLTVAQDSLKAELEGVYGTYAWTGVRLMSPGSISNEHTLRLDLDGRLAANDIKKGGYAAVSLDGKTVIRNHLLP